MFGKVRLGMREEGLRSNYCVGMKVLFYTFHQLLLNNTTTSKLDMPLIMHCLFYSFT